MLSHAHSLNLLLFALKDYFYIIQVHNSDNSTIAITLNTW